MRNKTAFIFLLLANLILLAHAVIPHYHHSDSPLKIAFEYSDYNSHEHHEELLFCDIDHEEGEARYCAYTDELLVSNGQDRLIELHKKVDTKDLLYFKPIVFNHSFIWRAIDCPFEIIESIPIRSRFLFFTH